MLTRHKFIGNMWYKILALVILIVLYVVNCNEIDDHPNWRYFSLDDCGQTVYHTFTGRIIGGKKAKVGQFPWMVRLGWFPGYNQDEPLFTCAGTLITPLYVVTAGHCGDRHTIVRLGEYDSTMEVDCDEDEQYCSNYQDIEIAEYVCNYYNKSNKTDDISVIRLKKQADINDFVRPICLPRGSIIDYDLTGKQAQVAGWGYVDSDTLTVATKLTYVTLPIIDRSECDALYRHTLTSSQLCIGTAGKDSCNGDSGGGVTKLMKLNHQFNFYLIGIVSYGKKDCGKGPAVYTYVAKYLKEILDAVTQ